jgi:sugar lactone lactonase YvrE
MDMAKRIQLARAMLGLWIAGSAWAHPGSGIVVNRQGEVFFTDTGKGVWKIDSKGKLTYFHSSSYHWMALSATRHAAVPPSWGDFEKITPENSIPTMITSSDVPITIGPDSSMYYAHQSGGKPMEVLRQNPSGETSVLATIATNTEGQPIKWVNGIAAGADGTLYFSEDSAVRKISKEGVVSTVLKIQIPGCPAEAVLDPPPGPYLRGLDVGPGGELYVAATGCRRVMKITPQRKVLTVLQAERPWSPTGVALHGSDLFILEYEHIPLPDRQWRPRVRKVTADGNVISLATVERESKQDRKPH